MQTPIETKLQHAAMDLRSGQYASYVGRCRLAALLEEAVAHMHHREEDHERWRAASAAALHESYADTIPAPGGER